MGIGELVGRWRSNKPFTGVAVSLVLVIVLSLIAFRQVSFWSDDTRLYGRMIEKTTDNFIGNNGMGFVFANQGRMNGAEAHIRKAITIKKDYWRGGLNWD